MRAQPFALASPRSLLTTASNAEAALCSTHSALITRQAPFNSLNSQLSSVPSDLDIIPTLRVRANGALLPLSLKLLPSPSQPPHAWQPCDAFQGEQMKPLKLVFACCRTYILTPKHKVSAVGQNNSCRSDTLEETLLPSSRGRQHIRKTVRRIYTRFLVNVHYFCLQRARCITHASNITQVSKIPQLT